MSISDGQPVNAAVTNAAYISRTADSSATGNLTFSGSVAMNSKILCDVFVDSFLTGADQTLANPTKAIVIVTDAGLLSISKITAPALGSQLFVLMNGTGVEFDIKNNNGMVDHILTGTEADITVPINGSLFIARDSDIGRWRVVGSSGASAPGDFIQETPSGAVDGVNDTFTLSATPKNDEAVAVYVNGIKSRYTTEYSVSGTTITFTAGNIPAVAQSVEAFYQEL